jgi:hypothetical protein
MQYSLTLRKTSSVLMSITGNDVYMSVDKCAVSVLQKLIQNMLKYVSEIKANFVLLVIEYYEIFYWEIFSNHCNINLHLGYHHEHDHRHHHHPQIQDDQKVSVQHYHNTVFLASLLNSF